MLTLRTLSLLLPTVSLALVACTTPLPAPQSTLRLSSKVADRIELTGVPFYPQEDDQCGPAALAMMLTFEGVSRTPEQMRDEVYLPLRQGSLPIEMVSAVRRAGLTPRRLGPRLGELLQEVSTGHPVTVLMNVRWRLWPQWHYAVVVGYDLPGDQILLRSGPDARHLMSRKDFEAQWAAAEHWALVALPVSQPRQITPPRAESPPSD